MTKKANCPTCGTKLSKLHDPKLWRTCTACERTNPRAFLYCGWCASPMENTEMRARLSKVAAPPGGWPSLTSELVEVRFFMDRGNFADAFELLSILKQRYPLHPDLEEFTASTLARKRPDTDVQRVVDSLMAGSAALEGSPLPRRAAARWDAPNNRPGPLHATGSQNALDPEEFDDEVPAARRYGKKTHRGHRPVASGPVVPLIPPEARPVAIPKKKVTEIKKRMPTQRFDRGPGPLRDQPIDIAGDPAPSPRPGAVAKASDTGRADPPADTDPLHIAESGELAPAAGVLYSEPETEEQFEFAAHAERVAAATREIGDEAQREVERARRAIELAALASDAEAAAAHRERLAQSEREAIDAMDAARQAVEEAVRAIPDRPGAQTGRTHVGPAPQAPPPAVTGDTAVGAPPEAPRAREITQVGLPPSAEPGFVPPRGLTMAVDVLQPAAPFGDPDDADDSDDTDAASASGRARQPRKRSMKPRKRSGKLPSVSAEPSEGERAEKVRRRAARFGQGIVGK